MEGMTPDRLGGLRVLDPACGSGSFLIGAFEYLIKYHERWYNNRAKQVVRLNSMYKSDVDIAADGHLSVSLSKRAQILRDNIFGVDIDSTATEVAALSLYLKLLEGSANTTKQLALFAHGTILPDLSGNLKCGNSLIDPSTGDTAWIPGLAEEEQRRLNPFAWRDEFRGVFKEGGFSAIIGNPPYVKEYVNKQIFDDVRATRLRKYCAGKMDIWYVFACVAIDLLRDGGYHCFITQNNWVTSHSAQKLRSKIRAETILVDFFDFHDYMVFENASIQTMIYTLRRHRTVRKDQRGSDEAEVAQALQPRYSASYRRLEQAALTERTVESLMYSKTDPRVLSLRVEINPSEGGEVLAFAEEDVAQVLAKIKERAAFSIRKDEVGQGIIGGPDNAFLFPPEERFTTAEKPFLHKHYTTSNRFAPGDSSSLIAYSTRDNLEKLDAREYPHFSSQIAKYKSELSGRREVKKGMIEYFHLHWPRDERLFRAGPKLACPTRVRRPSFYYAEEPYYASRAVNMVVTDRIDLKLLNGILNSSVVHFWLLKRGKRLGSMLQIDTSFLLSVPIPGVKSRDAADIIKLVDVLLRNHVALRRSRTTVDKNRFERAIATAEARLDAIVYGVFGLSEADIAVIDRELNTEPDLENNRGEGIDMEEPGSAAE